LREINHNSELRNLLTQIEESLEGCGRLFALNLTRSVNLREMFLVKKHEREVKAI